MSDTVETKTYINNLDRDEEENTIDLATAGTAKTRGFQTSEEGTITGLQDEKKYLEYLLHYLYKCISKEPEAQYVSFLQPSKFPSDSSATSCYYVSQLIWNTFIRMNISNKKTRKKNKKLLMSVDDMNRCLTREKETIMKLRNWIKYMESDLEGKNTFSMDQQAGVETLESRHTLLLELARIKAENQQLQDDNKALQRRTEELSDEIKDSEENSGMMQAQIVHYQERERQIIEAYNAEIKKMEYQKEQYDGLLNSLGTMQSQIVYYQERERQIIEAYNAEARKTEYQKEQYDGLLNRFSKLAGERLIHENTNITDLSDPNRPTKLAEAYSELYDNEWTDAFEELITAKHTDKEAIEKLLDIFMMSFHKCRELTWQRYQSLQSIVSTIDIHQFARGLPETLTCSSKMSFDEEKDIKHVWRTSTNVLRDDAVKNLHSALLTTLKITIEDFPKTSHYLAICIDLCWKMGMQEKPMHLDVVAETSDGSEAILDVTKFRYFTKTGKKVAFVVWPALLLHEGGPMLVKGIAQGCLETDI